MGFNVYIYKSNDLGVFELEGLYTEVTSVERYVEDLVFYYRLYIDSYNPFNELIPADRMLKISYCDFDC